MTYREVIRDSVRVKPKHIEMSYGDCRVNKQDFVALEKLRTDRWNGMEPTDQESGRGSPNSHGRSGIISDIIAG